MGMGMGMGRGSSVLSRSWRPIASGLGAVLVVAFVATGAHAFSFSLPAGQTIVDIDLSSDLGLSYDGTSETLTVTAEADVFRMSGGPAFDVTLAPGQVMFSLALQLLPGSLVATDDGGFTRIIDGLFENGAAADFSLWDTGGGPPVLLYGADFTNDVPFNLASVFGPVTGSIGGDYELHGPSPGDAAFINKFGTGGTLSVDFSNLSETTICGFLDGPCTPPFTGQSFTGMGDWGGQPNVDIVPIPEPSTAAAVALGLAVLAGRRRNGRRPSGAR